jgi:RHH-type proline utilization regulon transcriptional repressor/proline dehydrogenase/delta 1-pyrroline-5-carboxylate dehydrogenase
MTQAYLKEIITDLDAKLAMMKAKHLWEDGKWAKVLRNRLIDLSMWWKFANLTTWVLQTLQDDASVRKALSFAMPLLDWMCEPFVFPLNTALPKEQLEMEMDRLAQFVTVKREAGLSVTLDHVAERSLSHDEAEQYLRFYLEIIRHLAVRDDIEDINLSLKLSALVDEPAKLQNVTGTDDKSLEAVREKETEAKDGLLKLLTAANEAKEKKVSICIELGACAYRNAMLAIFKQVVEENPDVVRNTDGTLRLGIVVQASLRDAHKDLDDLMRWGRDNHLRVPVRLDKGACDEHEVGLSEKNRDIGSPVWNSQESADACYEELSEFLILNKDCFQFTFATLDIRSIAHCMALASSYGIGRSEFEFQMPYGMGDEIKEVITTMGYRIQLYVPAGPCAHSLKFIGLRFRELADRDSSVTSCLP